MNKQNHEPLGACLRRRRQAHGISTHELAERVGMNQASIVRIEQGRVASPDPSKLAAIANVLDLNVADVLSLANYPLPTVLPSPGPYLRAKYRDLPAGELATLSREVSEILKRHGIDATDGPAAGEDEAIE